MKSIPTHPPSSEEKKQKPSSGPQCLDGSLPAKNRFNRVLHCPRVACPDGFHCTKPLHSKKLICCRPPKFPMRKQPSEKVGS